MAFLEFPTEILVEIFSKVPDLTDLLACRLACKTFYQVFKDSTLLEYQVELEKVGMVNNSYCNLPTHTRLKMLRERERTWGQFDWKHLIPNIKVPSPSSPLREVTPSAAVLGFLDTNAPGESLKTSGFQFVKLPSVGAEGISASWKVVDMGEDILDFGLAIEEHDLLAYVTQSTSSNEIWMVLRHHSDPLMPHQAASVPQIRICSIDPDQQDFPQISIYISGKNIAVTVENEFASEKDFEGGNFLYVFDWTTGDTKVAFPLPDSGASPIFLREDLLLVPNAGAYTFQIYHISPDHSVASIILPILSLGLPPLADSVIVERLDSRCSPNSSQNPMLAKHSKLPFLTNPVSAIIVFYLAIGEHCPGYATSTEDFVMVVHRKALLDLIPYDISKDPDGIPDIVPWDSWGPPVARWFCGDNFTTGSSIEPWGQRFVQHVFPEEVTTDGDDDTIAIYDFNRYRIQEARLHKERILTACDNHLRGLRIDVFGGDVHGPQTSLTSSGRREKESSENIFPRGNIFRFDIIGKLPYVRYRSSNWPHYYEYVFMDEERLICTQIDEETDGITSMDVIYFG